MPTEGPPIRVYTSRWCGYCFAAGRLLDKLEVDFEEIPLDDEPELRRTLSDANNNWPTLPMIFIGDDFVGGYTELARLHRSGRLESILEKAV